MLPVTHSLPRDVLAVSAGKVWAQLLILLHALIGAALEEVRQAQVVNIQRCPQGVKQLPVQPHLAKSSEGC